MLEQFRNITKSLDGDFRFDEIHLTIYSTDASVYRERPLAVAFPKHATDLKKLIGFARENNTSLIPRGAGTSLAGQVVGSGIVVDVSKYMAEIISLDVNKKQVTIQPGVVLDELNLYLKPHGLFFGPETSTSNRCTLGGMVGNNACGSHSLIYGSTRDKISSLKAFLSDGTEVVFKELTREEFAKKCVLQNLEGDIYRKLNALLINPDLQAEIEQEFPDKSIHRRNTGYAIDILVDTDIFSNNGIPFNLAKLIAGSEGTLVFITEITLKLDPLPPKFKTLVAIHLDSLEASFKANLTALKYKPTAVELIDKKIIELAQKNKGLDDYRFFLNGTPESVLIVEFWSDSETENLSVAKAMESDMRAAGYGYHFPKISGSDISKVWHLRKAGLGILSNMPGDARPVALVEDTAVNPEKLPEYMHDFQDLLKNFNLDCVFYSHIGSGELHLRPILNLKLEADVHTFREFGRETAKLVKKYRGSLSGEHGDGRLRGEFIPLMYGDHIYQIFKEIKHTFDPKRLFNPGKITDTPAMNFSLRYVPGIETPEYETHFDFSETQGLIRAAEKCNGAADCRKNVVMGGTLCPSYMATRDERNSTRARANMLREVLTHDPEPFSNSDLYDILSLCLSCKACKTECPSNVDVAKLKAEFLQHYYDIHGVPKRVRRIVNISKYYKLMALAPGLSNLISRTTLFKIAMKKFGFSPARSFPEITNPLTRTIKRTNLEQKNPIIGNFVFFFADEFTTHTENMIGIYTYLLLTKLGYKMLIPKHAESGRAYLSKGLVKEAKLLAEQNINLLSHHVSENHPLIGIEPSAILTFRDEYPELVSDDLKPAAKQLAKNALMVEEFLMREMEAGRIKKESFTKVAKNIKLHGHCQQKAIASTKASKYILSFPENYSVTEIPSGCCGMAGSFGFEEEHYELSQKIGELVLFPTIRATDKETLIAAPGTSCRHQIKDGTKRTALHPVEILYRALAK